MEAWQWALLLKPLGLLILCTPGAVLVWWIKCRMPDSRLKRFLLISWRV